MKLTFVVIAIYPQVNDLTQEVNEVRREVSSVVDHVLATEDSCTMKTPVGDESLTKESAMQMLVDKLASRDTERAVQLVRAHRQRFGGDAFGVSDEDNLDCLVAFYCKHIAEKNVGSLVTSGPVKSFSSFCNDLMEVNVAILAAVEDLNPLVE